MIDESALLSLTQSLRSRIDNDDNNNNSNTNNILYYYNKTRLGRIGGRGWYTTLVPMYTCYKI